MGCSGVKTYEYKYFTAYRSIRNILKDIHHLDKRIENVYLVDLDSISKFIGVFKKYNFLRKLKLCQESEIAKFENLVLTELEKYEIEENIEILDIKADNYDKIKDKKFIFVDFNFLKKLEIYTKENQTKKQTLINKIDKKNKKIIEMVIEIIMDEDVKRILKIIEEEDGIYKFQNYEEESRSLMNEENVEKDNSESDNEFRVRSKKNKIIEKNSNNNNKDNNNENNENINNNIPKNEVEIKNNLIENDKSNDIITNNNNDNLIKIDNDNDKNNNDINNNKFVLKDGNNSNIDIVLQDNKEENKKDNGIQDKEMAKAPEAKLDKIVYDICISIQKSNNEGDIIMNLIQNKIKDLKMDNELEEKEGENIIGNIKTSVIYFLEYINNNKSNNNPINDYNNANLNKSNSIYVKDENGNESQPLLNNNNPEEMIDDKQNKINPFYFKKVKIFKSEKCDKCKNVNNKIDEDKDDYVKVILKEGSNDFDGCFNMKYFSECGNNCEFSLQFESTPDILVLVFDKKQKNKNLIEFNNIEESIDLEQHLSSEIKNLDSSKYKLIKALYVFKDMHDNKLYVDIPDDEKNKYIPYAIFYKKINNI